MSIGTPPVITYDPIVPCAHFSDKGRSQDVGAYLLDEQQPALLLSSGVHSVHRIVQPLRFHQPGAVLVVDFEHQDNGVVDEVAADRRVVPAARAKQRTAREIDYISA